MQRPVQRLLARASRALVPFALLLGVAACGDDKGPAADVVGGARDVLWQDAKPKRAALEETVLAHFDPPVDPRDWHIDSPNASVRNQTFAGEEERAPTLVLRRDDGGGDTRWDVGIAGEFAPDAFNVVRVHLATEAGCNINARLYRGGKEAYTSRGAHWVDSTIEGTFAEIEMPEVRFQGNPFEQLHLVLRSKGTLAIRSVELVHKPLPHFLPDPAEGADMVHLGPVAREAVGLWSGSPIEAEVELRQPAVLSFSAGVPAVLEYPSRHAMRLHVRAVGDEGSTVEKSITLPERGEDPMSWHHVEVPLHELAGARAKVTMELEVPGDAPGVYAIAESKVFQRSTQPRTVLLITSDTHRYDHVGAAQSGVEVATPTLDGIAARGVFFENCFTSTNVTNPSHVAIMTATHPRDTGILDNTSPLVREAQTLAESYRAAGYRTWAVLSAIHLGDRESGLGQGFDRMSIPNASTYEAEEAVDTLLDWKPDADGAPLFVWLHLFDAHVPYGPPQPFDRKYYEGGDPFDPSLPDDAIPVEEIHPSLRGLRDPNYATAQYRAEVDYLDSQIGRVMAVPRVAGGIVAVTADHGECLGQHGIYYDHGNLYPDTIHVPLVMAWPGAPAGRRVPDPIDQLDLGRTLLELSGIPDETFPGASMLPVLEDGERDLKPRFALGSHALSAAANYGRWHLIMHLREHAPKNFTRPRALHEVEFFDVSVDPLCENNVLDEHLEDAKRMRALLIDWLESASDTGWASEGRKDPATLQRLRDLGYTTADGGDVQLYDPSCDCEWCRRFQ